MSASAIGKNEIFLGRQFSSVGAIPDKQGILNLQSLGFKNSQFMGNNSP